MMKYIKHRSLLWILLLACILRLIAIATRSLWYDEAFAVLFSEAGLSKMLYGTLTPVNGVASDVHPLLYYTLLNGWIGVFGDSVIAVRMLSILIGLATIPVLYFLTLELFDQKTAILAALIMAIAPFDVMYSQEVRMYALLGLFLMSATWCFIRGWRTGKLGYWLGFGILAGLSMYTQQLAAFYLVALGLIPFLARRRDQIIRVVLSAGLAILIYFPWLISLPSQLSKISNYWIPRPDVPAALETLWSFIFVELEVKDKLTILLSFVTLALLLTFLLYFAIRTLIRRDRDQKALGLVLWLVAVPIGLMWLFSQWRPVYLTRGLLPSGLIFYIAIAWLLSRTRLPRPMQAVIAVPLLLTAILGLYAHYTWDTFPRPPFKAAIDFMDQRQDVTGIQIVHANKITMLPMYYYGNHFPQSYIDDPPGSGSDTLARPTQESLGLLADQCIAAAAKGAPRVWYVVFDRQTPNDLGWLDVHYHRVSDQSFNDLHLYLYDLPDSVAKAATCDQP